MSRCIDYFRDSTELSGDVQLADHTSIPHPAREEPSDRDLSHLVHGQRLRWIVDDEVGGRQTGQRRDEDMQEDESLFGSCRQRRAMVGA